MSASAARRARTRHTLAIERSVGACVSSTLCTHVFSRLQAQARREASPRPRGDGSQIAPVTRAPQATPTPRVRGRRGLRLLHLHARGPVRRGLYGCSEACVEDRRQRATRASRRARARDARDRVHERAQGLRRSRQEARRGGRADRPAAPIARRVLHARGSSRRWSPLAASAAETSRARSRFDQARCSRGSCAPGESL